MRVFGVFERNAGNRFTIDVQTANRSKIRRSGAPSDFFRQRLRFFAFYTFSPAVGTVEVSDSFIDRLTNPPHRQISSPQNTRGVVRPFLEASRHDPMHRRNKGTGSPGCRGVCYRCSGGMCAGRKALQHPPIPFLMEYSKNLYKRKLLLLTGYSTRLKTLNILPP